MIAKNLYKYANDTFAKYICTVTELSKIGTTGKSLVESEKEYYNFDAISQTFYSSDKCPTSADCLDVTKTSVQFLRVMKTKLLEMVGYTYKELKSYL